MSIPETRCGGHVFFTLGSSGATIQCAAFEPTKQFRGTIRELMPGDRLEVHGSAKAEPDLTINIEKLHVLYLAEVRVKVANPRCPACGSAMKSIGKGQGYRCRGCGTKTDESSAKTTKAIRRIKPGSYQVPVCARRHLSKPLFR